MTSSVDAGRAHSSPTKESAERAARPVERLDTGLQKPRGKVERKRFERELEKLHIELVKLQLWVKHKGLRIIVVFEGRDAAGKGGVIKCLTERVSPRVFRVVALPPPTERESSQLHIQRYITHFPAAGEVVIFDRSWYNRAGVERVMGFCPESEVQRFLLLIPLMERLSVESGIIIIKYWFEISQKEQTRRFKARIDDGRKVWKLSPMDLESHRRWYEYSRARDEMLQATDSSFAPWYIVRADDKRRARLNCIAHLLSLIPYKQIKGAKVKIPKRQKRNGYVEPTNRVYKVVPERF
jgi:polyphosphate kinase